MCVTELTEANFASAYQMTIFEPVRDPSINENRVNRDTLGEDFRDDLATRLSACGSSNSLIASLGLRLF
ncbi:hypothetical protein WN48_01208 [Eufriesea mexicana]|nr:hypothetical protein WN48_01208 [Eufriesea mexicana]